MIGISVFGSFTTVILAFYPLETYENFWRKPITGSIFALICIFGVVAVFFSEKCSKMFYMHKGEKSTKTNAENLYPPNVFPKFKGHHPNCEGFSAHVICMNGHVLCAACTGLFVGAIIALIGNFLYFFAGWNMRPIGLLIVLAGQIGIFLGLIQFKFKGYFRLTVNALFVFASFLVLVGMNELSQNLFVNLYMLLLIIFWLLTRILISQWDHWRICHKCELKCGLK